MYKAACFCQATEATGNGMHTRQFIEILGLQNSLLFFNGLKWSHHPIFTLLKSEICQLVKDFMGLANI